MSWSLFRLAPLGTGARVTVGTAPRPFPCPGLCLGMQSGAGVQWLERSPLLCSRGAALLPGKWVKLVYNQGPSLRDRELVQGPG